MGKGGSKVGGEAGQRSGVRGRQREGNRPGPGKRPSFLCLTKE